MKKRKPVGKKMFARDKKRAKIREVLAMMKAPTEGLSDVRGKPLEAVEGVGIDAAVRRPEKPKRASGKPVTQQRLIDVLKKRLLAKQAEEGSEVLL